MATTDEPMCQCTIGPRCFTGQNICRCQVHWLAGLGVVVAAPYLLQVGALPTVTYPLTRSITAMRVDEV